MMEQMQELFNISNHLTRKLTGLFTFNCIGDTTEKLNMISQRQNVLSEKICFLQLKIHLFLKFLEHVRRWLIIDIYVKQSLTDSTQ